MYILVFFNSYTLPFFYSCPTHACSQEAQPLSWISFFSPLASQNALSTLLLFFFVLSDFSVLFRMLLSTRFFITLFFFQTFQRSLALWNCKNMVTVSFSASTVVHVYVIHKYTIFNYTNEFGESFSFLHSTHRITIPKLEHDVAKFLRHQCTIRITCILRFSNIFCSKNHFGKIFIE